MQSQKLPMLMLSENISSFLETTTCLSSAKTPLNLPRHLQHRTRKSCSSELWVDCRATLCTDVTPGHVKTFACMTLSLSRGVVYSPGILIIRELNRNNIQGRRAHLYHPRTARVGTTSLSGTPGHPASIPRYEVHHGSTCILSTMSSESLLFSTVSNLFHHGEGAGRSSVIYPYSYNMRLLRFSENNRR